MDAIIDGIRLGRLEEIILKLPEWKRAYKKNKLSSYISMLELKPNVFGIGINLNAVLNYINTCFIKKYNQANAADAKSRAAD